MHEMSIVEALLAAIERELHDQPDVSVRRVRVQVGQLRQAVPETLAFCYDAATRDTPLAGSQLVIEGIPAVARCPHCGAEFQVEDDWFECPRCRRGGAQLRCGNELLLTSLELVQTVPMPV